MHVRNKEAERRPFTATKRDVGTFVKHRVEFSRRFRFVRNRYLLRNRKITVGDTSGRVRSEGFNMRL